jgi:HK97 family phage prohead protease
MNDEHTKALQAIEARRADNGVLTKDASPETFHKASGDDGILEGFNTRYWVVDSYGEFTVPGAFTKTIAERGPSGADRMFLRYEHEHTIGKHISLEETDEGVRITAKISDDGMFGTAVRAHLKDEVPYGLSIGFRRIASRAMNESDPLIWDYAPEYIRQMAVSNPEMIQGLTEIKLLEDSVVTFPAVDNALVTDYRAALDLTARALDRLMTDAKAGRLTDDHVLHFRQIAAMLPAETVPNTSEMDGDSHGTQTAQTHRNYAIEARYAELTPLLRSLNLTA